MDIRNKRARTRYKISRTTVDYRVSVNKTNQYLSAQAIQIEGGKVIASVHQKTFSKKNKLSKEKPVAIAEKMGEEIGKSLKEQGITAVAFDRSGYIYHGKIKAFAEGLRKAGLTL
jgi:large subunit ribosomal protein L18